MQKTIVLVADSMSRFFFFERIIAASPDLKFAIFTSEPLAYLLSFTKEYDCYLVKKVKKEIFDKETQELIYSAASNSIEVLNNDFLLEESLADAQSIYLGIKDFCGKNDIEKMVMWNGQQLLCRICSVFAQKEAVNTVFIEISNLPNKLFSDKKGVNALSSIYEDIGVIDCLDEVNDAEHEEWLTSYYAKKNGPVPQSKVRLKAKAISILNFGLKKILPVTCKHAFVKFRKKAPLDLNKLLMDFDLIENVQKLKSYVFLPLQVSGDTQIKLHSEFDNIDAIHYAHEYAAKNELQLVVKIHPAESDLLAFKKIIELKSVLGFHFCQLNTALIIKNSNVVITINSTVGLEALLAEKTLITLGRALYKDFDRNRTKKYVHKYLVDEIDYFDEKSISKDSANKVLLNDYQ